MKKTSKTSKAFSGLNTENRPTSCFSITYGGGVKEKFFIALLLAIGLKINLTRAQTLSLFSPDTVFENEQFTIKNTSSGYSGNAVFTLSISDLIGAYAEKDTTLLFNLFQGDSIQYKYDKSGTYIIKISRTASAPDSYKIQKK